MLILNRKAGESFTIDGQIKISILGGYGRVRIGIDAPKHIQIVRDELIEKEQRQNKQKIKSQATPYGTLHENTRS